MSALKTIMNNLLESNLFDRNTFSLKKLRHGSLLIRWRVTDLAYVALLMMLYPILYRMQPFQRQFYLNDITIQHPIAEKERVPNQMLFVYSTWVPLIIMSMISLAVTKPANKLYVLYTSILGLVISVLTASITTDILKNSFGRHRPDFLARCIPLEDAPKDVLVFAKDVCTTKNVSQLMDGFRTTPLGHSSISFAGLFFFTLWLSGQLTVTRPQAGAFRWALTFAPTLGAALIAIGRTEDYRHHFVDVLLGLCLGLMISTWLYLRLFPSPREGACYEPRLLYADETDPEYTPVSEV